MMRVGRHVLFVRNIFDGGLMRFVVLLHEPLRSGQFRVAEIGTGRPVEGCGICGGHDAMSN